MKEKQLAGKVKNVTKRHGWYVALLLISTAYVWVHRFDIYQLTKLNAQNLIFILWLILLAMPLFSEIEIGNVRLKREIEQTRAEVKESISELKYQFWEMKVNNTNSNMFILSNQPLPSKEELSELQRHVEKNHTEQDKTNLDVDISEDNIYLFKVRFAIEKQLSTLYNMFQYGERKSMHIMIRTLIHHEVINRDIADLIYKVISIANRGVHGEIVDNEYIHFVKKTYPLIERTLENANDFYSRNRYYFECDRCHYMGPSKYSNVCPNCGFTSDKD